MSRCQLLEKNERRRGKKNPQTEKKGAALSAKKEGGLRSAGEALARALPEEKCNSFTSRFQQGKGKNLIITLLPVQMEGDRKKKEPLRRSDRKARL